MSLAHHSLLLVFAVAGAALAACYTGPSIGAAPTTTSSPTEPSGNTLATGLPCEIATIVQSHCSSCHSSPPSSGATTSIASRADLLADHAGRPLAAEVVERLRDASSPMPPDGLLSDDDVATFSKWVDDGMPEGTCSSLDPTPTAITIKCTSGQTWTKGDDDGSALMTPGEACITCHAKKSTSHTMGDDGDNGDGDDAPLFTAAGTVYPSLHEPNDCYGVNGGAQVVLTGADGKKQTLTVNAAGNFMARSALATPYTASVIRNGKTRTMKTAQDDGDCNKCHTAEGGYAPGRIIAP